MSDLVGNPKDQFSRVSLDQYFYGDREYVWAIFQLGIYIHVTFSIEFLKIRFSSCNFQISEKTSK